MTNPKLMSYLEEMRREFWQERQHLLEDEIKSQWVATTAPYSDILQNTEAPTQTLELTSTQGQQLARHSSSKSWTAARRHPSGIVTPLESGQWPHNAPSSEAMSRKRARTTQGGPDIITKNVMSTSPLDSKPWQLDSSPPYCGYSNTSTSGPSFKARRTSVGRMPTKIAENSPNIRVYEPADYVQQSRAFPPSSFSPSAQPESGFNNQCIPSSSLESPLPFPVSPTTTVSEGFTDTTPPTSTAMSRQDSLATSFCGTFGMMRAGSGFSEIDSDQHMFRQDSYHGPRSNSFSPDGQGVGTAFDSSLYFAHAEGTAIENPLASMPAVEKSQLSTTLEIDMEMKRDISSSSIPTEGQLQLPSTLELHTEMVRDASSNSNISSSSRISRRSQEQIVQAARPIAPKDVAENSMPKQPSSSPASSQEMLRQRSAPEPKMLIPKLQYSRQSKEKLKCAMCKKNPDGYRGAHELHRHIALDHHSSRVAWVCVDISADGFLSGCAACESKKPYGQDYNAAAHLRRFHFHPKSEVRRTNVDPEERRGGKGGGKDPPMSECRRWMEKIQVPGKDYMALADSSLNHAGDDATEDDEATKSEQVEQEEMVEDIVSHGRVPEHDETFHPLVEGESSASRLDGANDLELGATNDRRFIDIPPGPSGLQSAFGTPFETYHINNTASYDPTYSHPTLSSSAPVAPSFLSSNLADPFQTHGNFACSNPDPFQMTSTMSTTNAAHTLEDFSNFQSSYILGNVSYEMPSPNNPAYGLLDSPPFR